MYNNIAQLLSQAKQRGVPLHEIVLDDQMVLTGASREEIYAHLAADWDVMKKSATRALVQPQDMHPPLIRGQAARQQRFAQSGTTLCGAPINGMMAMALSASEVNAAMGRICAAPTAGACGILPAVLCCAAQRLGSSEQAVLDALLVAAGIGAVITKNATVSGAQGGCQAECGTAAAMAGAAAVYLANGTPEMCANAAAISLINCMGLICDPVAGLVQLPCSFRNASQSANALASADMALAGQSSVIPPDEVIEAMYAVGKSLPGALRETAQGGIAATQTGQKLANGAAEEFRE